MKRKYKRRVKRRQNGNRLGIEVTLKTSLKMFGGTLEVKVGNSLNKIYLSKKITHQKLFYFFEIVPKKNQGKKIAIQNLNL